MNRSLVSLLLLSACASEVADGPRVLPSSDVLCQIWQGTGPTDTPGTIQGWGTNADDVRGILGEPSERKGSVWTYEFTKGSLTLTFEQANLCGSDGKVIQPPQWISSIKADGIESRRCWIQDQRNKEPTCDGCIGPWSVAPCS